MPVQFHVPFAERRPQDCVRSAVAQLSALSSPAVPCKADQLSPARRTSCAGAACDAIARDPLQGGPATREVDAQLSGTDHALRACVKFYYYLLVYAVISGRQEKCIAPL